MGIDPRNQDDRENGCRSLGSEILPSGQSRKISIGVLADENVKVRSGAKKEDAVAAKTKRGASRQKLVEENEKRPEMEVSMKEKEGEDPGKKSSPWVTTRSSALKTPASRTVQFYATRTLISNTGDGAQKKFSRVNETPKSTIVQAKQSVFLQSSDGLQKKVYGVAYGRSREKGENSEKVEEFAFAAAQEVHVSDKGGEEKKESKVNQKSDSLKQKLWEALETAPSQKDKTSDSETECLNLDNQSNHKSSRTVKGRQNSDTIETDSEKANIDSGRPVTRSLTRKKSPAASHPKLQHKISNERNFPTNLSCRWGNQKSNIFTFSEAEENSRGLHQTSNSSSKMKSERKNGSIKPRRISFSGKKNSGKTRQGTDKGETPSSANKTPPHGSQIEKSRSIASENNRDYLQTSNGVRKEEIYHSSESKKPNRRKESSSPELQNTASPQEDLSGGSPKNARTQDTSGTPSLAMNTTIKNSFPNSPSPISKQVDQGIQSPAPVEKKSSYNLRTRQKSKQGLSSGLKADTGSSDDNEGFEESPIRESSPSTEAIDRSRKLSASPEDGEEESPEKNQHINQGYRGTRSAAFDDPETSPNIVSPRKRHLHDETSPSIPSSKRPRHDGPSSTSPSQKGIEESNELLQLSRQNQGDGLMRAVAHIALGLERFKTRINTQTSRKSAEILTSLREEMQIQLRNADSQIQRDVLKFSNLGKSKRKSLETRFQEQQERLKSLQCKFKEEVAQHLQEYKNMFEDLEAFQLELKGDAKRQKALHQKLISQVEEAIGIQLSDADRRITAIHKVARDNMLQLRNVIAECLKELT